MRAERSLARRLRARVCRADALSMVVVAGCVIFHRRQLLLREPRIPPPSFYFFFTLLLASSSRQSPLVGLLHPSLFVSQPLLLLLPLLPLSHRCRSSSFSLSFSFFFLFLFSPSFRTLGRTVSFSFFPSVVNIRRGHADLRFADLAFGAHRNTEMRTFLMQRKTGTPVPARVCAQTIILRNDFQRRSPAKEETRKVTFGSHWR